MKISEKRKTLGLTKPHIYLDPIYGCWTFTPPPPRFSDRAAFPGALMAAMKFCRRLNNTRLYGEPTNPCSEVEQP